MSKYTKVLEFFMENGITLNKDQIQNIKILCEGKAKAHGYAIAKSSEREWGPLNQEAIRIIELYTRKIDILNNKLRRGEITQEELNKEFENIKDEIRSKYAYLGADFNIINHLSKDGSKYIDKYLGARQNKTDTSKIKPEEIKDDYNKNISYSIHKDPNIKEKIQRHYIRGNSTENPKEAIKEKEFIQKRFTNSKDDMNLEDYDINVINPKNDPAVITKYNNSDTKTTIDDNTEIYRKSRRKNETEAKPSATSYEGLMYGKERIYGFTDKNASGSRDHYKNNYKLDKEDYKDKNIHKDQDVGGDAVYINTDKKIKQTKESKDNK